MKLGIRIFAAYLLVFVVCFSYPINWVLDNLRTRYLEGVEDPLVDQAYILAGLVGAQMSEGRFDPERLYAVFQDVYARSLSARIYDLVKTGVDMRVVVTDDRGRVLFHSVDDEMRGEDHSRWRDVRLTLEGAYGARTTLDDPGDPTSSVLHVAAPIIVDGRTAGVLTVAKPTTSINSFLHNARPRITRVGLAAAAAAVVLSFLVSYWVTRPIKRLTGYAEAVRSGNRAPFPRLDATEIGELGKALQRMQEALDGKQYVERYVQNLTHEIKGPLSAIRGAAELMEEEMPAERRQRFLGNIRSESERIQRIVDRLLDLAALENRKGLDRSERLSLRSLAGTVVESKAPLLAAKHVTVVRSIPEGTVVSGDAFLLHQALSNLVQNALDFAPENGRIEITASVQGDGIVLSVADDGPGIPPFALEKAFDKFFSLRRPGGQTKSTGLGLNFVREVANLHGGSARLENRPGGGARAVIVLRATAETTA
ncbi:MAG: two-component system sensor histidine kinase CreC [Desulfobacteraceae bacterium]|nr:two-component system sensor histidine kinase CreC [Desulfobacteraceae bacterium]